MASPRCAHDRDPSILQRVLFHPNGGPSYVSGKILCKGSRIIAPFRQLHFDRTSYGSDDQTFDPNQLLRDKMLARAASYRPFGGGTSSRPGCFLARQEVKMVIAILLHSFELSLEGEQDFPVNEFGKASTVIAGR